MSALLLVGASGLAREAAAVAVMVRDPGPLGIVDDDPALRDLHAHLEGRHATRSRALGRCTSPTTTPATTTRTSESATAAAGSVSRWR